MQKRVIVEWVVTVFLIGGAWGQNVREELKQVAADSGLGVAIFNGGKLSTATMEYPKKAAWSDESISGAVGHSFSYQGMISPDGRLGAFPYWPTDYCPSMDKCDTTAHEHFFLAIVKTDGAGDVRTFPEIVLPSQMCWTRDNAKLAMVARFQGEKQLIVVHVESREVDRLGSGENVTLEPQCWSPDGKQLVYFAGDKDYDRPGAIRILDTTTKISRELLRDNSACKDNVLCQNPYPTWSPDGEWIAFLQDKAYWAVHPSGDGRKKLFGKRGALSPLQWSPDMRYALYGDCCAFRDTWRCMCEIGRIHVRRLADNEDIEISADGFQDMYTPLWVWVQKK